MKLIFLVLLSLSLFSCASQPERDPSSTQDEQASHLMHDDYYGSGSR